MRKRLDWRQFVEQRHSQLDIHPCAIPTNHRLCPTYGTSVGPVTGICKPCRDQLYQQLCEEYLNEAPDEEINSETPPHEQIELEQQIGNAPTDCEPLSFQHPPSS